MTNQSARRPAETPFDFQLTDRALVELREMGLSADSRPMDGIREVAGRPIVPRRAITAPGLLNEATDYSLPSSFSRGLRIDLPDHVLLLLSGTSAVDDAGNSVHVGDFQAQCMRTFRNLTGLLAAEEASWFDIVRTTCYLRDIERDYDTFNRLRTAFFAAIGLDPVPASTAIQARICRTDLLVEIEAIAMLPRDGRA